MEETSGWLVVLVLIFATPDASAGDGAGYANSPDYGDNAMAYHTGDGGDVIIVSAGGDSKGGGDGRRGEGGGEWNLRTVDRKRFVHPPVGHGAGYCSVDQDNCILEEIPCSSDDDCTAAFPMLQLAMGLGKDSNIPSRPFCTTGMFMSNHSGEDTGTCSCGTDRCVSYSRQFGRDTKFFYCGPCGYMGSECRNRSCTHEIAQCQYNYCECSGNGVFYEFSFCTITYMGYETALQIAIIICIVIACCLLVASIYTIVIGRRLRGISRRLRDLREQDLNDSPANDTPPSYEEVADKLPTYQDALRLAQENDPDGVLNLAFEDEDHLPLPSQISQEEDQKREEDEMEGEFVSRMTEDNNRSHRYSTRREITIAELHEGVGEIDRSGFDEVTQAKVSDLSSIHQSTVVTETRLRACDSSDAYQSNIRPNTHSTDSDSLEIHESSVTTKTEPNPSGSSEVQEPAVRSKITFQPIETPLQNALEIQMRS